MILDTYKIVKKVENVSFYLSLPLISVALYLIFMYASAEKSMGLVQKIFYFHVGSATSSYLVIFLLFISAVLFLSSKKVIYDLLVEVSSNLTLLLTTIVLASGMIWGKAAWGTWFSWEPRLTSFLLIWLMFLSIVVLRKFSSTMLTSELTSVLAIISSVLTPVMIYSIKFLPNIMQLHPEIERNGLEQNMKITLLVSMLSILIFTIFLLSISLRIKVLEYLTFNKEEK